MKIGLLLFMFLLKPAFALYGESVKPSIASFVVSLQVKEEKLKSFCSGVLVSKTTVLTAGHCINIVGFDYYGMSQGLVYRPEDLIVTVGGKKISARSVTYSPSYFEGNDYSAEDLALIELSEAVTNVAPIAIASKKLLTPSTSVTLIARQKQVTTKMISLKQLSGTNVLFLDKNQGACIGDSGGAVVVNQNGQQKLAGILMYDGDGGCERKTGYAYFPKLQF